MTKRYTRDNYRSNVLPKGLHKDCVDAITVAVMGFDWTVEVKHIRAVLRAPEPHTDQSIPFSASAPPTNMNSIKRKVETYGKAVPKVSKESADGFKAEQQRRREDRLRKEAEVHSEAELAVKRAAENYEKSKGIVRPDQRTLLSALPLVVTDSGRTYDSDSTIERKWSNGDVDYACAVPGCKFTSESKYGPGRGHRKIHVAKGEVVKGRSRATHKPEVKPDAVKWEEPKPAKKTAKKDGLTDAEVKVLADDKNPPKAGLAKDAEAMVAAIRSVLDDGESDRQAKEIAALKEKIAALEVRATEAETERDRLTSERSALRDLLDDKREAS